MKKIIYTGITLLLFTTSAFAGDVIKDEYVIEKRVEKTAFTARALNDDTQTETITYSRSAGTLQALSRTAKKEKVTYQQSNNLCAEIMSKDSSITACSPNFIKKLRATPNDSSYSSLWGLKNSQYGFDVKAEAAWNLHKGNSSTAVAVLDTGVDYRHPDLAQNIWTNSGEIAGNNRDDDSNGFADDVHGIDTINNDSDPMDDVGHGTHVSGSIGAVGNNSRGVVGVNWETRIIPVKFLSENDGTLSGEVKGIDYIVNLKKNKGVNVVAINASFGGSDYSDVEFNAIKRARDAGILLIVAAGNDGSNNDQIADYPSNYNSDNIVVVASVNRYGQLSDFSNYGRTNVELAAPGEDIYSTVPNSSYDTYSGTSMAAPHVTGAVALLASYQSNLNYSQLKDKIVSSTTPLSSLSNKVSSGGMLNLFNMLSSSQSTPNPDPTPTPNPTPDPTPEPEPQPTPDPGDDNQGDEYLNSAVESEVGDNLALSNEYVYLFVDSKFNNASTAYVNVEIDNRRCPFTLDIPLDNSSYTVLSGRFGKNKKTFTAKFVVSSNNKSSSSEITVAGKNKRRAKNNFKDLCKKFKRSAEVFFYE
ncbi:MAG: S8 family serine peptidase [Proteobacteria bacterium]|nr:S8 family serine peptidase [Pseudomonadota bacterium]